MVTVWLSACLPQGARVTPEHAIVMKHVGLVVLVSENPNVDFIGPSVMESNRNSAVLNHWHANRALESYLARRFKTKGFETTPIAGPAELMRAYDSSRGYARPELVRDDLVALGREHQVDMIVTVYRQVMNDFIAKSSENVRGYGLFKSHRTKPYAYGAVLIEVLDVQHGSIVGRAEGSKMVEIEATRWKAAYETTKGPFTIGSEDDAYLIKNIGAALRGAALLAAQEAGLSN